MSVRAVEPAEIRTVVRVGFLLRLFTLLASLLGFVNQSLTPMSAGAIIVLALTSMAGIALPQASEVLTRHPFIVAVDAVVITLLMFALGTDNPLILGALSSCVIIGVVLTPLSAALAIVIMISGYLAASFADNTQGASFLSVLGFPITFISVAALGQVFRLLAQRNRASERALADLVTGTAAAAERSRLARELHDSTAKTLQGLSLTARSLLHWIEHDPVRAREEAGVIATTADDATDRLRSLLSTLRVDRLEQPFHESLAALARDCVHGRGIRLQLELEPVNLSAPSVRYELLAAAREAITNAVTHSGGDRVAVDMTTVGDEVIISVRDFGRGFSLDILAERERDGHFGVRGFAERMQLIGGRADVDCAPGAGTTVVLAAPVMGLLEEARD